MGKLGKINKIMDNIDSGDDFMLGGFLSTSS